MDSLGKQLMDFIGYRDVDNHIICAPSREVPVGDWEWSEDAEAKINEFLREHAKKEVDLEFDKAWSQRCSTRRNGHATLATCEFCEARLACQPNFAGSTAGDTNDQ